MSLMYTITKLLIALLLVSMTTGRATEDFKDDLDHEDLNEDTNQMEKREAQMEEVAEGDAETSDDAGFRCLPGPVGPRGLQGTRGRNGRDGRDGHSGFDGFDGEAGLPGKDGEQGPAGPAGPPGNDAPVGGNSGVTYVRWGRTLCKDTAELIYKGIAGGGGFNEKGNGANYLCLPEDPEFDFTDGPQGQRSRVYSAEYEFLDMAASVPLKSRHDRDTPCAVCDVSNRGRLLMIPAKMTCPEGWTEEYHGYLMSELFNHERTAEFICVDHDPEVRPGGEADKNGANLYLVEGRCVGGGAAGGSLPCDIYPNGHELTCVVCTK